MSHALTKQCGEKMRMSHALIHRRDEKIRMSFVLTKSHNYIIRAIRLSESIVLN